MKPNQLPGLGLNRRALLSSLAVLPTLVGLRIHIGASSGSD